MLNETPFIEIIKESPGLPGPHAVYADYLEENGECDKAEQQRALAGDDFDAALARYIAWTQAAFDERDNAYNQQYQTDINETKIIVERGPKWAKVVRVQVLSRSVHCFVALVDHRTKALGNVKRGDIHKPASWRAPAKHARGNIFQIDFGKPGAEYIRYLR